MNELLEYAVNNTGRVMAKPSHNFEIYDKYFSKLRGQDIHLVEFGVAEGGSLQMWKQYFGPNAKIYGIDINPNCKQVEEEQIEVFIGDQKDRNFLRELAEKIPRIDILIDDGGHTSKQQIATYEELFPHIDENGIYACEDLWCSYDWRFGGGYKRRGSIMEYAKNFLDYLHAWDSNSRRLKVNDFTKSVHAVHFYYGLMVIEKRVMPGKYIQVIEGETTLPEWQEPFAQKWSRRIRARL